MFRECTSLTNLDLSNFDFTSTINLVGIFMCCKNLENVCITQLNKASNLQIILMMFADCEKLKHIYTSKAEYDARSENCNSLNFDLTNT
ncbi:MAG: hypothetical protein MJ246_02120 [Clostridia bacterium]|nr:hypothetical protein [Clostridia bacterium]